MGWMDLIDNKLEKLFNSKPDNEAKVTERRRKGVLAGIDAAIAAHKKGDEKSPRGWYTTKSGVARCTVRTGTKTVPLNGQPHAYVPHERVSDFYTALKADVAGGKLDKDINQAWMDAPRNARGVGGTDLRQRSPRSTAGRPLDPEKVYQRNVKRYGKERADELRAAKAQ